MSQPRAKIHRDYKPLIEAAEAQGWTLVPPRGKGHCRLIPPPGWKRPDGQPTKALAIPGSPSDHRSLMNTRSRMRRNGIDC